MHYIAIATFTRELETVKEILLRRRQYAYPPEFKNTQSWFDVQGGRAVIHFETDKAEAILRYTTDWPELDFDVFAVIPTETAWEFPRP
jgi:hypothetical protein